MFFNTSLRLSSSRIISNRPLSAPDKAYVKLNLTSIDWSIFLGPSSHVCYSTMYDSPIRFHIWCCTLRELSDSITFEILCGNDYHVSHLTWDSGPLLNLSVLIFKIRDSKFSSILSHHNLPDPLIMSSIQASKKRSAHRLTCVCRAFDCYLGQYVDANGRTQAGVEVLPATLAAHKLADRVQQATLHVSNNERFSAANPTAPYSTAEQDTLKGAISQLNLAHDSPLSSGSCGSSPTVDESRGPNTDTTLTRKFEADASAKNAGVPV